MANKRNGEGFIVYDHLNCFMVVIVVFCIKVSFLKKFRQSSAFVLYKNIYEIILCFYVGVCFDVYVVFFFICKTGLLDG